MRRFCNLGLLIALCAGLAACQGGLEKFKSTIQAAVNVYERVTTTTVTPTQIVVVANAFDSVKSIATGYLQYCKGTPSAKICAPGTKASPGPLRRVIAFMRTGTTARDKLEPFILTGGAGPGDVFNVLVDSVNGLNAEPISQTP